MYIGKKLTDEELARVAIHEAGHALGVILHNRKLWRVEIYPKRRWSGVEGHCSSSRWFPDYYLESEYWQAAQIWCAGPIAEALFYGAYGDSDDIDTLSEFLSKKAPNLVLDTILDETLALLKPWKNGILAVADELFKRFRLSGKEVTEIVQSHCNLK